MHCMVTVVSRPTTWSACHRLD